MIKARRHPVLKTILIRWLRHISADGGYAGAKMRGALQKIARFTLHIGRRTDKANGESQHAPRDRPGSGLSGARATLHLTHTDALAGVALVFR